MADYLLFNAFANSTGTVTPPIRMGEMTNLGVSLLVIAGTTTTTGASSPAAVVVEQSNDGAAWTQSGITQPAATDLDGKTGPANLSGNATGITMRLARIRLTGISTGVIVNVSATPYRT